MVVTFDPAAFYGHHEYDIAIDAALFVEKLLKDLVNVYFNKIPKAKGFKNRNTLYNLYIYLSHWYGTFNINNKSGILFFHSSMIIIYYVCRNQYGAGYSKPTMDNFEILLGV